MKAILVHFSPYHVFQPYFTVEAGLAQSVERQALNLMVEGSSPSFGGNVLAQHFIMMLHPLQFTTTVHPTVLIVCVKLTILGFSRTDRKGIMTPITGLLLNLSEIYFNEADCIARNDLSIC